MPVLRCALALCNSDGRYKDRDYMKDVTFYTFPTPDLNNDYDENTIKCREWIKACDRPADQLNIKKIHEDKLKRNYYYKVCSKVYVSFICYQSVSSKKKDLKIFCFKYYICNPSSSILRDV